ncbi:unnamed protein product [Clavelina lepadiformis]|uniref:Uncharacterized protein n=1 Tax=Clavelina lepadiformis TaxID=159417 RepID=A0ABP0FWF9_CLALP
MLLQDDADNSAEDDNLAENNEDGGHDILRRIIMVTKKMFPNSLSTITFSCFCIKIIFINVVYIALVNPDMQMQGWAGWTRVSYCCSTRSGFFYKSGTSA